MLLGLLGEAENIFVEMKVYSTNLGEDHDFIAGHDLEEAVMDGGQLGDRPAAGSDQHHPAPACSCPATGPWQSRVPARQRRQAHPGDRQWSRPRLETSATVEDGFPNRGVGSSLLKIHLGEMDRQLRRLD